MENHPCLWRRIRRVRRIQVCMARKGLTAKTTFWKNSKRSFVGFLLFSRVNKLGDEGKSVLYGSSPGIEHSQVSIAGLSQIILPCQAVHVLVLGSVVLTNISTWIPSLVLKEFTLMLICVCNPSMQTLRNKQPCVNVWSVANILCIGLTEILL